MSDLPVGPVGQGGHIPLKLGTWSTAKPVVGENCTFCLLCWILCPEGVMHQTEDRRLVVDHDYCKGCGICAHECPIQAIEMVEPGDD